MLTSKVYKLSKYDTDVYWGELPSRKKFSVDSDLREAVIMGSVKYEKPKAFFQELLTTILIPPPAEDEEEGAAKVVPDICPVDEIIRHTIRLNDYSKKLQRFIRMIATRKTTCNITALHELRKVPEMIIKQKEKPQRPYSFVRGQGPPLPALNEDLINKMLKKAVIIILAHTGFDTVRETALDTLVDVVKENLRKICLFCHAFDQKDLNRGQIAYTDVLEKSLRHAGFDGVQSINDYYKKKVIGKRDVALARANRFVSFYDKVLQKHGIRTSADNIPELHFPATGNQSSEALHAILKPGYKMLQTLDQEAQQSSQNQQQ